MYLVKKGKWLFFVLFFCCSAWAGEASVHAPLDINSLMACRQIKSPETLVHCLSDRFLLLLKGKNNALLEGKMLKDGESVADNFFAFSRMASSAFGRQWLSVDISQRQKIIHEFRVLLFKNYSKGLARFSKCHSVVSGSEELASQAIVRTAVSCLGKGNTSVDYYLIKVGHLWMIYDVSVSGISLVASYRQQMEAVYTQKGVDGVLNFLRRMNERDKSRVGS